MNHVELTEKELEQVIGGATPNPAFGIGFVSNTVNSGASSNASNIALGAGSGTLLGFGTANGVAGSTSLKGPLGLNFTNGISQSSATGLGVNYPS